MARRGHADGYKPGDALTKTKRARPLSTRRSQWRGGLLVIADLNSYAHQQGQQQESGCRDVWSRFTVLLEGRIAPDRTDRAAEAFDGARGALDAALFVTVRHKTDEARD